MKASQDYTSSIFLGALKNTLHHSDVLQAKVMHIYGCHDGVIALEYIHRRLTPVPVFVERFLVLGIEVE